MMALAELVVVPLFWAIYYYWAVDYELHGYNDSSGLEGAETVASVIAWTIFSVMHVALLWAIFAQGIVIRKALKLNNKCPGSDAGSQITLKVV
jgi:hypothetical protein